MIYSVVLLDGKERQNLSFDEVKDLFFKRQINQNSLICSAENPSWLMLKRAFDLAQWIPSNAPQTPPQNFSQNAFPPPNNPFEQPPQAFQPPVNQAHQPVSFNQFPPNNSHQPNNNFAQNTSKGYSQNNQTETYYQAETHQSQTNYQNNHGNFAPSKYNNAPDSQKYAPNYANNFANNSGLRNGAKQAAIFIILNTLLFVTYNIVNSIISAGNADDGAYKAGYTTGRLFIPLLLSFALASKLWKQVNIEKTRKWTLAWLYIGFLIVGIVIPYISFQAGQIFVGILIFTSAFFYFVSLALVLHGKENPSQSRVMIGMGTFAVYFLVMVGILGLSIVGKIAPQIGKANLETAQFEKYKIEGREFEDKTTGAKVVLPEGWSMIALDNPVIHSPEARMIAVDKDGNRLTMLEVVPVPGNLDMKRVNPAQILDQMTDNMVKILKEQAGKKTSIRGTDTFNEVARLGIYVGKHPAKLLVFDQTTDGEKLRGQMIMTYDELTFYVLHSWCKAEEYENSKAEFSVFEKNFTVPEKINSPFTQSAETLKNNANTKKTQKN